MLLEYLNDFSRLLEIPLINCKVELKLGSMKHCALTWVVLKMMMLILLILFLLPKIQYVVHVVTLSAKDNKNYQNTFVKDFKDQFIQMNIKQKVRIKARQISIDSLSNQILLVLIDCLFWFIQIMKIIQKGIVLRHIMYQKILLIISTSSSMEKTFMTNRLILI